ncbi:MAG: transcription termination/antitermination protein NusG [Rickettsiales bacterium]|nr:transcription termination/antitermination protein NusG [Rickettsiales bacterium]
MDEEGRKVAGSKWYVLQVYSGCEKGVMETLKEKIVKEEKQDSFESIMVPTQEVNEVKRGKKVSVERKFFPRYVLIKMIMNDATWHLVNDTPRVMGFLGTRMKPESISEKDAEDMLSRLSSSAATVSTISYEIGEQIKVCDGPFASFNGFVESVDEDKQRLKVAVSIFGRPTQVDLEFAQVEKV